MTARLFDRFDGVLFVPVTPFEEHDRVEVTAAGGARRRSGAICTVPGWRTSRRPRSAGALGFVDKDSAT